MYEKFWHPMQTISQIKSIFLIYPLNSTLRELHVGRVLSVEQGGGGVIFLSLQLVIAWRQEKHYIHYVKIWPP